MYIRWNFKIIKRSWRCVWLNKYHQATFVICNMQYIWTEYTNIRGGGRVPICGFLKNVSSKERLKPWFFVTVNVIIGHIFPENFIEIPLVVQKIWRISLTISAIFIDFFGFLTFPCYKETNDVSLWQIMLACFFTFNIL